MTDRELQNLRRDVDVLTRRVLALEAALRQPVMLHDVDVYRAHEADDQA